MGCIIVAKNKKGFSASYVIMSLSSSYQHLLIQPPDCIKNKSKTDNFLRLSLKSRIKQAIDAHSNITAYYMHTQPPTRPTLIH